MSKPEEEDVPGEAAVYSPEQQQETVSFLKKLINSKDLMAMSVSVPVYIHEGDSGLERHAYMGYPELFMRMTEGKDALARMENVVAYYFSTYGSFLAQKKKPFNPVVGEQHLVSWNHGGHAVKGYYEQISHHPAIMAGYIECPTKQVYETYWTNPEVSFTGLAIKANFHSHITVELREHGETYEITIPTWYLRGILLGKSYSDFVGEGKITCKKTGLKAILKFKEKPWFRGEYRRVSGRIMDDNGKELRTLHGKWDTSIEITDEKEGTTRTLYKYDRETVQNPTVAPIAEQDVLESRRLWAPVAQALAKQDYKTADQAKKLIENFQRIYTKNCEKGTIKHQPDWFTGDVQKGYTFKEERKAGKDKTRPWLASFLEQQASESTKTSS